MKNIFLFLVIILICNAIFAQEKKLYDPDANATADIVAAIKEAAAKNKFVLIQAGGNWCSWCIEFARVSKADPKIDSVISSSFVLYHLNWSKENRNDTVFARYGYPQRFGFPVFIVLDSKGERMHTQNSAYLEDGEKSYNPEKVLDFLEQWSPKALDPKSYHAQ